MKITDVTLTLFAWESIPSTIYGHHTARPTGKSDLGLLRIATDEGIEGHAFLGTSSNPASLDGPGLIRFLKPLVMGQDPLDRERLNRLLWGRARVATVRSIGAVDIALRHPGLFGTVESWGGYFVPFADGPLRGASREQMQSHDPALLVRREAGMFRRVRFFLSSGPTHGDVLQSQTRAFGAELAGLGIPHVTWLLHTRKADWRGQLTLGLRYAVGAGATS